MLGFMLYFHCYRHPSRVELTRKSQLLCIMGEEDTVPLKPLAEDTGFYTIGSDRIALGHRGLSRCYILCYLSQVPLSDADLR